MGGAGPHEGRGQGRKVGLSRCNEGVTKFLGKGRISGSLDTATLVP